MKFAYFGYSVAADITILNKLYSYTGAIGCDVETISLEDRTPLGLSFAINYKEAFYFPIDSPFLPWYKLYDPDIQIIFHNSGFDVRILEDYSHKAVTNVSDSCIAALLLGFPGKLADLCWFLFGRAPRPIEALIGKGKDQITMDKVPIKKVAERACLDAQDALEAWDALKDKVPWKAIELETRFLPVAMNMERRGIRVDIQKVSSHRQRLEKEMTFLRNICEKQGFNPGSSIQLGEILEYRGYKVLYKTGKDGKRRPRLNKEILSTYYIAEPAAAMTLKYRSTQTLLTHLIKPIDDGRYINNGIIYPRVNLNVAATGRISRSVPATQNINEGLRDIIIPTPGNIIYDWDFTQIELRCAAYMWEDKVMEEIFQRGEDVHTGTANELVAAGLGSILGDTPAKRRRLAKDLNFAMLFGGDEETLWNRKQIPKDIGKKLVQGYFERFKGIARGIEATKEFALKNGYTKTLYGRRRDESDRLQSGNKHKIAAALRELVNHPIQGTAAEILKEAMWMDQKEPQFHTVHDEVLLDVPADYEYRGYLHKVAPFKTEIKAKKGFNWKDLVEV